MGKKVRLKKEKKHEEEEEEYNDLSENEEDENPDQNNYIKDDFLVDDDEEEIDNVPRFQISDNDSLKDEEEEESLNSSDREVIGQHQKTKKKKLRKKNKEQNEDSFNEDINNINFEKSPENKSNNEIKEDENYSDDIKESNSITNDLKLSNNDNIAHQIFKIPETEQIQQPQEKTQIKQIFTPDELEEQLATPFDNEIKINDYPERMQLLYSKDELPNLMDNLEAEVNWIFDKMKFNNNDENEENLRKKIFLVLECNKKDFLDIPYIVMFKKYIYDPELTVNNIWKIFELDRKYYEIIQYKKLVNNQYNNIKNLIIENQYEFLREKYINEAKSINDLKKMEEYINYIKECSINEDNNNNINENNEKHIFPIKKSFIKDFIENKINLFINQSMLNSMEIAINLEFILKNIDIDSSQLFSAPVPTETPIQLANKFINNVYKEEMDIMNKACKFIAINLTSHPFIKSYIYSVFYEICYISTKPTEKGSNELDIFHPLFRTKRIYNKHVSTFDNDLFMYIIESEKKNLISVDVKIKENINNNDDKNNNEEEFKELKKFY
jgi:transcription elongation factor SPT6